MIVAKYLEHAKIDETLNTYAHLLKNKIDDIVNMINHLKKIYKQKKTLSVFGYLDGYLKYI